MCTAKGFAPLRRAKPSAGSASQERKLCRRNSPFLPCFRAAGRLNPSAARGACRQCALSGPAHAVRSARPLCPGTAPGRPARALSGEGARMAHSSTFGAWLKSRRMCAAKGFGLPRRAKPSAGSASRARKLRCRDSPSLFSGRRETDPFYGLRRIPEMRPFRACARRALHPAPVPRRRAGLPSARPIKVKGACAPHSRHPSMGFSRKK